MSAEDECSDEVDTSNTGDPGTLTAGPERDAKDEQSDISAPDMTIAVL